MLRDGISDILFKPGSCPLIRVNGQLVQTNLEPLNAQQTEEIVRVPNTDRPLPIPCPKCQHTGCTLVVVMAIECPNCRHSWATELEALPEDIQRIVRAVLRDDD